MYSMLNKYKGILFFGGGIMAERLYNQISDIDKKLIGVFDLLKDEERTISFFRDYKINNANSYRERILCEENAIVVAIGHFAVFKIVNKLLVIFPEIEDRLFVVNPYSSLRFFMVDDELASDDRIPFDDIRYKKVKKLLNDEESIKHFNMLINSKTYDGFDDLYEFLPYKSIKEMYYYTEDYWNSYVFDSAHKNEYATVIDCGAYIGDSVAPIVNCIPENSVNYYALEPLEENVKIIKETKEFKNICESFSILEYGVGDKNEKLYFHMPQNGDMEGGRFISDPSGALRKLEIKRIDDLPIDYKGMIYIKMDIEGSELKALKGAKKTIVKYHPYLAICLYHRKNDLVEIPLFISDLGLAYNYYLRGGYHTILWAVPK